MKKASLGILVAVSISTHSPAFADKISCVFTEPFYTIHVDTSARKVVVKDDIGQTTRQYKIRNHKKEGNSTQIIFGAGQEEFTSLRMNLDFKGSNGMSETVYPFSAELQTGDTPPHHGGCSSSQYPSTESILDCDNIGDAIEGKLCESSLTIECEDSVKSIVSGLHSIRSGKSVQILRVKEIIRGKRYSVNFKIKGHNEVMKNLVTTSQARHGSSCASSSVEIEQK